MPALLAVWCTVTTPSPAMSPSSTRATPSGQREQRGHLGDRPRLLEQQLGDGAVLDLQQTDLVAAALTGRDERLDGQVEAGLRASAGPRVGADGGRRPGRCRLRRLGTAHVDRRGRRAGATRGRPGARESARAPERAVGGGASSASSPRLRPQRRRRGERPASKLKPFITSANVGSDAWPALVVGTGGHRIITCLRRSRADGRLAEPHGAASCQYRGLMGGPEGALQLGAQLRGEQLRRRGRPAGVIS